MIERGPRGASTTEPDHEGPVGGFFATKPDHEGPVGGFSTHPHTQPTQPKPEQAETPRSDRQCRGGRERLREEETKLPLKRRPTACLLTAVHTDWDAHCRSTQADAI